MAERRMFAKTIIDSDAFLNMPLTTQALYFHLSMRADDDGFVNNPTRIQRMVGAQDDDLRLLIAKSFVLTFESGVIVIKHWRINNYIRNDRYHETVYQEEKALLSTKDNDAYTFGIPSGNQEVYQMDTEVRLGKDRLGKDRLGKDRLGNNMSASPEKKNSKTLFIENVKDRNLSEPLIEKLTEWIEYKVQRKEPYVERGIKSFLTQMEKAEQKYGTTALMDCIDTSMSRGYKGIITDIIDKKPSTSTGIDWANV